MKTTEQQPVTKHALTIWPPFAALMAAGIKTLETRRRSTNFRGEFYIHAAKAMPPTVYVDYYIGREYFREIVNEFLHIERDRVLSRLDFIHAWPSGVIVGKGIITDSGRSNRFKIDFETDGRLVEWERESALGDHGAGSWAWSVKDAERIPQSAPIKGVQNPFWKIPDDFILF